MFNISRTPGTVGGWINPEAKVKAAPSDSPVSSQPSVGEGEKPADLSGYKEVTFSLTFYTDLPEENGGYSVSASGAPLKKGMVASNAYDFGTEIILEGMGKYKVGDRGGYEFDSPKRIDVLIERKPGESDYEYKLRVLKMGRPTIKGYVKIN